MLAVKIKRVYEDGTILYIHPKSGVVYLFDGENFKNRYKIDGSLESVDLYEKLLNKTRTCEYKDYIQKTDIKENVLALIN